MSVIARNEMTKQSRSGSPRFARDDTPKFMPLKTLINSQKIIGLAPMDGITDEVFRLVQTKIAKPDIIFTEFVNAEGLSRGGVKLYDQLLYSVEEKPIVGQLFGKDPESFYKSAIILCELGFDGVDINLGCPAKTVVHNGSGAALIGQYEKVSEIIKSVQSGINDWFENKVSINDLSLNQKTLKVIERNKKYSNIIALFKGDVPKGQRVLSIIEKQKPTISVKTRLGITESIVDKWIPFLLDHNLDFMTLHGRTLKQGYAGFADWNEISKAAKFAKNYQTKFFGNGDISSHKQALEFCEKYGVDGILIGRASMGNPWLFMDHEASFKEKFSAMLLHTQLFQKIFPERKFDSLRKHFLLYSSGYVHAKQLRSKLVRLNSLEELLVLEEEFLNC
jgi:tRNA-dihydrouridine synthase B